jgi:hypothetical protein
MERLRARCITVFSWMRRYEPASAGVIKGSGWWRGVEGVALVFDMVGNTRAVSPTPNMCSQIPQ